MHVGGEKEEDKDRIRVSKNRTDLNIMRHKKVRYLDNRKGL